VAFSCDAGILLEDSPPPNQAIMVSSVWSGGPAAVVLQEDAAWFPLP